MQGISFVTYDSNYRLCSMKKNFLLIFFNLFTISLFSQETVKISADLDVGREVLMGEASVKFLSVLSDSRCPKQVTCIWPGEAKVLLGITVMGEYFEKEVVISGTGAEFSIAQDLQFLVSDLRPYPETAMPINPKAYCLRIGTVEEN